jgi:hypothetical protein
MRIAVDHENCSLETLSRGLRAVFHLCQTLDSRKRVGGRYGKKVCSVEGNAFGISHFFQLMAIYKSGGSSELGIVRACLFS